MKPNHSAQTKHVVIESQEHRLEGEFLSPPNPIGVVLFAHGSGSSRLSPRNQLVARELHREGIATLLFDLLEEQEAVDRRNVFDVELLAGRLLGAVDWVHQQAELKNLPLGFFGASTGAAAALIAAAESSEPVAAVVSRGGRPDLAERWLSRVTAPTLLIVGGEDDQVIEMNRFALGQLICEARMEIVPGATHLFEEPGTLEEVARLAAAWFATFLLKNEKSEQGVEAR
jgi:putative phosphoribosyl transferase